jgi:diacylglycerol kinase (ATP)
MDAGSEPRSATEGKGGERAPASEGPHGPVALVLSPHAGRAEQGNEIERALRDAGVEIGERLVVSELDRRRPLGLTWRARGFRAVIAAGGDGTVGAVVSHLDGSGLPLGILPLGTSNDTARSLGIPMDLHEAAQVIATGRVTPIDAGQVVPALSAPLALAGEAPQPGEAAAAETPNLEAPDPALGAYFLHALTLGFNVQFARLATDVARRARLGNLNYAVSLLQALATFRPVAVTLRFSGIGEPSGRDTDATDATDATITCEAFEIAAVNTPVFGGALNMRVPDVGIQDRLLDFVVFEALDPRRLRATVEGALAALTQLPEALHHWSANHIANHMAQRSDEELGLALPGIRRYKARAALIASEQPLGVTLDGEVRAKTPVRVGVAPRPVPILLPATP